jgi:hypothetical protein
MRFLPLPREESARLYLQDLQWATAGPFLMWMQVEVADEARDDTILRVEVKPNKVGLTLLGLKTLDYDLKETYASVDELPNWVQEKLALLMLTSAKPPTQDVEGVGRRVSECIFWVYPPEDIVR